MTNNTLRVKDYLDKNIWLDDTLDLFRVEDYKELHYYNGDDEIICSLNEDDLTIGNCSYCEYSKASKNKEKPVYHRFFKP